MLPLTSHCFLLVSQQAKLDAPSTACGAALTSTSGTPARRRQRLLTGYKVDQQKINFNLITFAELYNIMSTHLVQTDQDTVCVSLCPQTSLTCICLYHFLSGWRFQSRPSAYCYQVLSWHPGQSSSPYSRRSVDILFWICCVLYTTHSDMQLPSPHLYVVRVTYKCHAEMNPLPRYWP